VTAVDTKEPAAATDERRGPNIRTSKTSFAKKLARAIEAADEQFKPHRKHKTRMVEQYVGPYYGDSDIKPGRLPINTLYQFVSAFASRLVINPRCEMSTPGRPFSYVGKVLAEATNTRAGHMGLGESFRTALVDSLFGLAILKCGQAVEGSDEMPPHGYLHDPAEPFVDPVSLDDYGYDYEARRRDRRAFEYDKERLPLEWALDYGHYDRGALEAAHEASPQKSDKTRNVGDKGPRSEDGELYEMTELIHVWLPQEMIVVDLPGDVAATTKFVGEVGWDGPERGPYEELGLIHVPDHDMPLAAIAPVYDVHLLLNVLARKIARQAEREKELTVVEPGEDELANTIRKASDGAVIMGNPNAVKRLQSGGPSDASYKSAEYFEQQGNRIGGNPNLVGGSQAQSETLGQEQMLWQSAGVRLGEWRNRVLKVAEHIFKRLAWYVWHDEDLSVPVSIPLGGGHYHTQVWTPRSRQGAFKDYELKIEPYALHYDTPKEEYTATVNLMQNIVVPLAPILAQQGIYIDAQRLLHILGKKGGLEEFAEIFRPGAPIGQGGTPQPAGGGRQPGETVNINMGRGRGAGTSPAETQQAQPHKAPAD